MTATAKVRNANGPRIVLDGGGKVTLSGGGTRRILYMNTCDKAQGWTTSHCQDQDHPQLTVQNLTFADGNSTGETDRGRRRRRDLRARRPVQGRQLARSSRNRCDPTGPDLGGAAIRVLEPVRGPAGLRRQQHLRRRAGQGGVCSNGGALSSIGVSWVVLNSVLQPQHGHRQRAPTRRRRGTPGGGSGGAIYIDGNLFTRQDRRHASSRTTTPTRAAARSSSSATTAPAP